MKNFVFISPNFPESYWKFCAELKNNGLRVLGIGDCPYDELKPELKNALHEYYKVSNLENYEEVFRAVAFLTYKYGKIDYLESNNEYWLERDAKLRTEFHITTGFNEDDIQKVKYKSAMKQYYAKAGVPTARYHLVDTFEASAAFASDVGYPVVVKPDNGVGASHTYRLNHEEELKCFFATKDNAQYIMEELVKGYVRTYDAIIDWDGKPLFETGNVTPSCLMDVVNTGDNSIYYIVKELPEKLREMGRKTVEAFGVKGRFVHLEYFVLTEDQEGLGKAGDFVGLEVNMRPAGGYSPDMYNFAHETDVFKIWADMIAFNQSTKAQGNSHFCGFVGRRDGKNFVMDHNAVMGKYGSRMKINCRLPAALASAMGDQIYIANVETQEELDTFFSDLLAEC